MYRLCCLTSGLGIFSKMIKSNCIRHLSRILSAAINAAPITTPQILGTQAPPPAHFNHSVNNLQNHHHRQIHLGEILRKYNKKSNQNDETDSDDEDDPEFKDERDSKVLKTKVNSLRADLLLKAGLGIARNKIETIFYESKIRVNGKKLAKKSAQLNVGDEIDVIRGFSQTNPSHLVISRVVVLAANERDEGLSVNLRRYKSLLVENYAGLNGFKSSETSAH